MACARTPRPANCPTPPARRCLLAALATGLGLLAGLGSAPAHAETRSWQFITTGNGRGFQYFNAETNKVVAFLEHPYRYTKPRADERSDGFGRRNLGREIFFGLRTPSKVGWLSEPESKEDPRYVDQTNIILVPSTVGGVKAESFYFAPYGYGGNAMIALLHAPGASQGYAYLDFHMGGGAPDPNADGEALEALSGQGAVIERGPGGGAMVYVALSNLAHADCGTPGSGPFTRVKGGQDLGDNVACNGNDVVVGLQSALGADGWMAVAMQFVENADDAADVATDLKNWGAGRTGEQILNDARAEWDGWRKPPPADVALCSDDEKKLWRQSEAVLRMGQVTEPRTADRQNTGMMLASLPQGEWHSGWVRDAIYAIVALARTGHHAEAKAALDFYLNVNLVGRPGNGVGKFKQYVSNQDYRISVVRYYGTGEEEADYSGQQTPNVEIDGWGMVLWGARQYVEASGDVAWLSSVTARGDTVYDALLNGIARPLEANLESNGIAKADSSIWEVHDANKRHYAYTSLAATRGICDMAALANKMQRGADVLKYKDLAAKMRQGFLNVFVDPRGALAGSLEGLSNNKYYDGAVAEAFTWNILPDFKGETAKATLDMFGNLRVDSGGFKRNNDGLSSYDNNEWILVDLRIADSLRRFGRTQEADAIVAMLVSKAASNFYLLPELFNAVSQDGPIGKYTGSIPMVGYGGGAYILTVMDRAGLVEPNDCGDGAGHSLPKVNCEGVVVENPGTTAGGVTAGGGGTEGSTAGADNGPGTDEVPYLPACLCRMTQARGFSASLLFLLALPAMLVGRRVVRASTKR